MQRLLTEFRELHQECLQIDQSGDSREETLQRRPPLARCPMPADLAGTTATVPDPPGSPGEWPTDPQISSSFQDPLFQQLHQQVVLNQAKVEEREAQAQELQDTITELHQEMSRKDEEKLTQLQELHRLDSRVKELSEEVSKDRVWSSPAPHPTALRGTELLKSELSLRDATIQRLRRDLLHSHQARDALGAQLDARERRISGLQGGLRESQLERQRGHSRILQLQRDLHAAAQQTEELRKQLSEVKGRLVQVEGENESHREYKLELSAEVERLTSEVCCLQTSSRATAEAERKHLDLERQLSETRAQLSQCQDVAQDASKAEERALHLEAEVTSLKMQQNSANQLLEERSAELQVLQKDYEGLEGHERQQERDATALQLQLQQREKTVDALTTEMGQLRARLQEQTDDVCGVRQQLLSSQDALQQLSTELRACRKEKEEQLIQEEETTVKLQEELREAGVRQDSLTSRVTELSVETQRQRSDLGLLTEQLRAAQREVASRDSVVLELTAQLRTTQEHLRSAKDKLAGQVQDSQILGDGAKTLEKEVQSLRDVLNQRETALGEERHKASQLAQERDGLLTQIAGQQGALRAELRCCREEARMQAECREEEVQGLREELQEAQARIQQNRCSTERLRSNMEKAQRQHREAEEEASQKETRLRALETELSRLRTVLQEAQTAATDSEARLQPLASSLDVYKQKYQTCLAKVSQLECIVQAQEEDLREAALQASEREDQALRLRADMATLQSELRVQCAQLDSGDHALSALSQRLWDSQRQLEDSRRHGQECELVIGTMRESVAALRSQVEEREEMVVKIQADFSAYQATHTQADSDYETYLSHVQELEQELSHAAEQCARGAQELAECQSDLCQLREEVQRLTQEKSSGMTEVLRLQEEERRRRSETEALEQRATRLEEDLRAAQRQCTQREQAVQKRDTLLRQSEVDLVEARKAIRGKAAEVRGLEAELQRAKTVSRQREGERAALNAELMQLREELKEAHSRCRDTAQELARLEEKVLLAEGGQQRAQEHLTERVAEVVRAERAQSRLQAQLRGLKEQLSGTDLEIQGYRAQVERMKEEASASKQAQLCAQQEALQHQQGAEQLDRELTNSRELIRTLQQQVQEQAEACRGLRTELAQQQAWQKEQQAQAQRAKEREAGLETQSQELGDTLNAVQKLLKERDKQVGVLQERVAELHSASLRLREELQSCQAQLLQCKGELAAGEDQRHRLSQELVERSSEVAGMRSELSHWQQRGTQLAQEGASQEDRLKQLTEELLKLRCASRNSQGEVRTCEGQLAELCAQLELSQHWGQEQLAALESQEEESIVLRMELVSLRQNYHVKVDALHSQLALMEEKHRTAASEVEVLRQSLGDARSDSSRLRTESELVVSNVQQWVKEQKQANEKLGNQIKEQSKKVVHLTAEKDHLRENREELHREIRRLKAELDDMRKEAERFRDLHIGALAQLPGHSVAPVPACPGENPRRKKSLRHR